ncbi:hypothetical protein [Clostridium butyricum]|uniref:hypothetical protein n=1 Tax=Clostridium butyricum TaxID=1492 RepID=UPI002ABE6859|nr:hypothetical protein [Clostridium butyricum]
MRIGIRKNKATNSKDVCKIFGIPESILNGSCTNESVINEQYQIFTKQFILPIKIKL